MKNATITSRNTPKGGTVYTVKLGNQTVDVYQRTKLVNEIEYTAYEVADYTKGARRMRSFNDQQSAFTEAEDICRRLGIGDVIAAQMDSREAAIYGRAVELARSTGVPLEIIVSHFAEAFKILGGDRIVEAAKDFVRRNPLVREPHTVKEVADEMVKLKRKKTSKLSARYTEDLDNRLTKFGKDFTGDIANITGPDMQAWFDGMDAAPRTVKNFRSTVSQLFKFAESRGYITRGENPVLQTDKISTKGDGEIEIYTPEEISRLLAAAPDWFQPIIALQAFAGLRSAEVARLTWADINQAKGHIVVAAHKAKTASRRIVPIVPSLAQWLAPYAAQTSKLWKHSRAYFHEVQNEVASKTKVEANAKKQIAARDAVAWRHNALRHSFCSYRLAVTQNAAQVALEAGNSPGMIFRHYREIVSTEDAATWFSITPEQPANVTTLAAAKGAR